ncbi:MAG: hypothetical protein IJU79_01145 [Desulfovibrionaceae bacterium]|nr:hypothetical protein [Desulfovibrionaceae bacterium]
MSQLSEGQLKATIYELAMPLVEAMGLCIWGLEVIYAKRLLIRLYIESQEAGETQADLEHCAEISRQLGLALDVENIFAKAWTLEVSSPGLDRMFFKLEQLGPYIGDVLCVHLSTPLPPGSLGRKVWRGTLLQVTADSFSLKPCEISADDRIQPSKEPELLICWENCRKVQRVALFPKPLKPGKGAK